MTNTTQKRKGSLIELTTLALLMALIILLGFTPVGLIPLGFINVTTLCIPVIIGTVYNEFTPAQEDPIFRPLALQQAAERSAAGCAPVYMYLFKWATPVLDGVFGSTHCLELPFVFDNVRREIWVALDEVKHLPGEEK